MKHPGPPFGSGPGSDLKLSHAGERTLLDLMLAAQAVHHFHNRTRPLGHREIPLNWSLIWKPEVRGGSTPSLQILGS